MAALRARLLTKDILVQIVPEMAGAALPDDDVILESVKHHQSLLGFLLALHADRHLSDIREVLRHSLLRRKSPSTCFGAYGRRPPAPNP